MSRGGSAGGGNSLPGVDLDPHLAFSVRASYVNARSASPSASTTSKRNDNSNGNQGGFNDEDGGRTVLPVIHNSGGITGNSSVSNNNGFYNNNNNQITVVQLPSTPKDENSSGSSNFRPSSNRNDSPSIDRFLTPTRTNTSAGGGFPSSPSPVSLPPAINNNSNNIIEAANPFMVKSIPRPRVDSRAEMDFKNSPSRSSPSIHRTPATPNQQRYLGEEEERRRRRDDDNESRGSLSPPKRRGSLTATSPSPSPTPQRKAKFSDNIVQQQQQQQQEIPPLPIDAQMRIERIREELSKEREKLLDAVKRAEPSDRFDPSKYCSKCGTFRQQGFAFCPRDGTAFFDAPPPKTAPAKISVKESASSGGMTFLTGLDQEDDDEDDGQSDEQAIKTRYLSPHRLARLERERAERERRLAMHIAARQKAWDEAAKQIRRNKYDNALEMKEALHDAEYLVRLNEAETDYMKKYEIFSVQTSNLREARSKKISAQDRLSYLLVGVSGKDRDQLTSEALAVKEMAEKAEKRALLQAMDAAIARVEAFEERFIQQRIAAQKARKLAARREQRRQKLKQAGMDPKAIELEVENADYFSSSSDEEKNNRNGKFSKRNRRNNDDSNDGPMSPAEAPIDPLETMGERLLRIGVDALYWDSGDTKRLYAWTDEDAQISERLAPGRVTLALSAALVADVAATATHGVFSNERLEQAVKELKVEGSMPTAPRYGGMSGVAPGESSMFGAELFLLLRSIHRCRGLNAHDFAVSLRHYFGIGCNLPLDEVIQTFLARKRPYPECGTKDCTDHLLVIVIPVVCAYFGSVDIWDRVMEAARVIHTPPEAMEWALASAIVFYYCLSTRGSGVSAIRGALALIQSGKIEALKQRGKFIAGVLDKSLQLRSVTVKAASEAFGLSRHFPAALQMCVHNIARSDVTIEHTIAVGGPSCPRSIFVAACKAAMSGDYGMPAHWVQYSLVHQKGRQAITEICTFRPHPLPTPLLVDVMIDLLRTGLPWILDLLREKETMKEGLDIFLKLKDEERPTMVGTGVCALIVKCLKVEDKRVKTLALQALEWLSRLEVLVKEIWQANPADAMIEFFTLVISGETAGTDNNAAKGASASPATTRVSFAAGTKDPVEEPSLQGRMNINNNSSSNDNSKRLITFPKDLRNPASAEIKETVKRCMFVLYRLSAHIEESRITIAEVGLKRIIQTLESQDTPTLVACSGLLCHLALEPNVKAKIIKLGFGGLCTALSLGNNELCYQAVRAVSNISENIASVPQIVEKGFVEVLIQMMVERVVLGPQKDPPPPTVALAAAEPPPDKRTSSATTSRSGRYSSAASPRPRGLSDASAASPVSNPSPPRSALRTSSRAGGARTPNNSSPSRGAVVVDNSSNSNFNNNYNNNARCTKFSIMAERHPDDVVLLCCLLTLVRVCGADGGKGLGKIIDHPDTFPIVVHLLRTGKGEILHYTAALLRNLSTRPDTSSKIVYAGVVGPLLQLLQPFNDDNNNDNDDDDNNNNNNNNTIASGSVGAVAAAAAGVLSKNNNNSNGGSGRSGTGSDPIRRLLWAQTVGHTCACIFNLVNDEQNKLAFIKGGLLPRLVDVCSMENEDIAEFVPAIFLMLISPKWNPFVERPTVIARLLPLFISRKPGPMLETAKFFAALSLRFELSQTLLELGIVNRLRPFIAPPVNDRIKEAALLVIRNLVPAQASTIVPLDDITLPPGASPPHTMTVSAATDEELESGVRRMEARVKINNGKMKLCRVWIQQEKLYLDVEINIQQPAPLASSHYHSHAPQDVDVNG